MSSRRQWRPQFSPSEFRRGWVFFALYLVVFPVLMGQIQRMLSQRFEFFLQAPEFSLIYYFLLLCATVLLFLGLSPAQLRYPPGLAAGKPIRLRGGALGPGALHFLAMRLPYPVENPNAPLPRAVCRGAPGHRPDSGGPDALIEEVLFRGSSSAACGATAAPWPLRSPPWATLFCVASFVFQPEGADLRYLLLAVQYLPMSLASPGATTTGAPSGRRWPSIWPSTALPSSWRWAEVHCTCSAGRARLFQKSPKKGGGTVPRIQVLESHVADLIAAGEVVERPASVVKELVENAIDAGASALTVEIQHGGMTYIRITDDGCGMEPGDVGDGLPPPRHQQDPHGVRPGGHRHPGIPGEALAAIAAVARVEVLTRRRSGISASPLTLEGGGYGPGGGRLSQGHHHGGGTSLQYSSPPQVYEKDAAEGPPFSPPSSGRRWPTPRCPCVSSGMGNRSCSPPGRTARSAVYAVLGRDLALGFTEVKGSGRMASLWRASPPPGLPPGLPGAVSIFLSTGASSNPAR